MIPYLQPGGALTAAKWNAIFMAADALLTNALGGLSALFSRVGYVSSGAGVFADGQWDRCFFFFDPQSPPSNLHPLVPGFLANATFGPSATPSMFLRLYSDAGIASGLSGCSVSATSSKFGAALMTAPVWTAWAAAVYPGGFGSYGHGGLVSGSNAAVNCLDVSLAVVTTTVSSTVYAVTFADVTTAEHAQPLKPIDVFVAANFTWLTAWNKYSVVRIHNCANASVTVTFGSASQTLNAGASLCVRQLASGWVICGNYFHWMESGDGRFLALNENLSACSASIFKPGVVADVLKAVLGISPPLGTTYGFASIAAGTSNLGGYFDPGQFWDCSGIYNNAAYSPSPYEKNPPSGGYLPALSPADLLGDLMVHRGQVLVANRLTAPTRTQFAFTGFAALAAALSAAGVTTRAITQTISSSLGGGTVTNLEIYFSTTGAQDLIDLSCPLVTFITSGNPASNVGSTQTSSPPSLTLPHMVFYAPTAAANPSTSNVSFYNWGVDADGNPMQTTLVTLTVQNAGSTASVATKVFLPTDSVATVTAWIASTMAAGGIIRLNATNPVNLLSTPFGPVLEWSEIWPLSAAFTAVEAIATPPQLAFITKVQYQPGIGLIVTRSRFLADGANVWPPRTGSGTFLPWNFPRVDQRYSFQRFFYHNPADAPMMPNWTGSFAGSNYANEKYLSDPWGDAISNGEFLPVQSFYEFAPLGVDAPLPVTALAKTGISRLGAFVAGADNWPVFANWFNSLGNLSYPIFPDISGGTGSVAITTSNSNATDWYSNNVADIIPSAAISYSLGGAAPNPWQNVLPCQCEHYNLLASLVNGQPPMKLTVPPVSPQGFTLSMAAANIIIVNGGTGYAIGDQVSYHLQVSAVSGTGAVTAVTQNGAVWTLSETVPGPVRPFPLGAVTGSGAGALVDTNSGSAGFSFIPGYQPQGVPLPAGMTGSYWPRTAYFCWNGPTPGGADPIGAYLASLGMTVQTTVPDGYGAVIVSNNLTITNSTPSLATGMDSPQGFDANFAIVAGTYRWVSIADARTLYAKWSLPFVLNELLAPMEWMVVDGSLSAQVVPTNVTTTSQDYITRSTGAGDPAATQIWSGITLTLWPLPGPPASPRDWVMDTWLYNWGPYNVRFGGFVNAAGGNWLTTPASTIISNQIRGTGSYPGSLHVWKGVPWNNNDAVPVPAPAAGGGGAYDTAFGGIWALLDPTIGGSYAMSGLWSHTIKYATVFLSLDYGGLNPQRINPGLTTAGYQSLVALLEGMAPQLAAVLPQNFSYYDPAFAPNNPLAVAALGTGIVPIIVDNSVEQDQAEATIIPGGGGAGQYDHTITTGLANGRLLLIPIDGQTGSQNSAGAGNTSGTGAGGSGGAGGGGGGL